MAIRKPGLSVTEAKRLAAIRSAASEQMQLPEREVAAPASAHAVAQPPPVPSTTSDKAAAAPVTQKLPDTAGPVLPTAAKTPPSPASPRPAASATDAGTQPMRSQPKKVQVFVSAFMPAPNVSPVFDILSRQYPSQKALQMILRRALDDYEDMLLDGTFQKGPVTYGVGGSVETLVETSRMMPRALLTVARAHFDPLGLESARAFGFKLATAALAAFFSREIRR